MGRLLLLATLAALSIAATASAQFLYMDGTGDGVCDFPFEPVSLNAESSIDIWIDTANNPDGSPATCSAGELISIDGYELVLQADANAEATAFHGWQNAVASFTTDLGAVQESGRFRVGFFGGSAFLAPGKHKLGTVRLTYSGSCPSLGIRASATLLGTEYVTQFNTDCPTADADYILRLDEGFGATCNAGVLCTGTKLDSTWGQIKSQYK